MSESKAKKRRPVNSRLLLLVQLFLGFSVCVMATQILIKIFAERCSHRACKLPLSFSDDRPYPLAVGYPNGRITLYEPRTGEKKSAHVHHTSAVQAMTASRDGELLVSSSERDIIVWQRSKVDFQRLHSPVPVINSISLSPDSKKLAVGGSRNEVVVVSVDALEKRILDYSRTMPGPVRVSFSPNGKYLVASGDYNSSVKIWTVENWEVYATFVWDSNRSTVYDLCFSPDNRFLAVAGWQQILVWSTSEKKNVANFPAHSSAVVALSFSPDGHQLASSEDGDSEGSRVILWNTSSWKLASELPFYRQGVVSLAFSPDSLLLAVGRRDGVVSLWDLQTQTQFNLPR